MYKHPKNVSKKFYSIPSRGTKDIMSSSEMSRNKKHTNRKQTDLVPEVGHLKNHLNKSGFIGSSYGKCYSAKEGEAETCTEYKYFSRIKCGVRSFYFIMIKNIYLHSIL